jgi:G:T-mismatch repair DNA endonuclease (very short patch repair protein)
VALKSRGWKACVFWECDLKEPTRVKRRLVKFLENGDQRS